MPSPRTPPRPAPARRRGGRALVSLALLSLLACAGLAAAMALPDVWVPHPAPTLDAASVPAASVVQAPAPLPAVEHHRHIRFEEASDGSDD